jgi:hypothetical protein
MPSFKVILEREVTQACETIVEAANEAEAAERAVHAHAENGPWWVNLQTLHMEAVDFCEIEWELEEPADDVDFDTHILAKALN